MQLGFGVNSQGEGTLISALTEHEEQRLISGLELVKIRELKASIVANDKESEDNLRKLYEDILPMALRTVNQQPDFLPAHYIVADYALLNSTLEDAFNANQRGMKVVLNSIPDDFMGQLSMGSITNESFFQLYKQMQTIINVFLQMNLNQPAEKEGGEYYWFGKNKFSHTEQMSDADFDAMRVTVDIDFNDTLQCFIDAHESIGDLVGSGSAFTSSKCDLAVLYALLFDFDKAIDLLMNDHVSFYSAYTLSAIYYGVEYYNHAFEFFRHGMQMNRHFPECITPKGDRQWIDKINETQSDMYAQAIHYANTYSGALWWSIDEKQFAAWASKHSLVEGDIAAIIAIEEKQLRGDPGLIGVEPYELCKDRIDTEECEIAVEPFACDESSEVYPWEVVIDKDTTRELTEPPAA